MKDLEPGHFVSNEWNLATFAAWQFYLCTVPVTFWAIYNHTGCGCLHTQHKPGQSKQFCVLLVAQLFNQVHYISTVTKKKTFSGF